MPNHKVRHGETLTSISKLFQVERGLLISANHITDPDKVKEGQVLLIPEKRQRESSPVTVPAHRKARPPAMPTKEKTISEQIEEAILEARVVSMQWLEGLLQKLRATEANEHVQHEEDVDLSKDKKIPQHQPVPPEKKGSRSARKLDDVKIALQEQLGKEPHIVQFGGVKLTQNEKKQIVAAVAICEMNANGFGSINSDQEFIGRKYGKKGIAGLSYSRIVHIGLSYGVIQYTQDSGSLGALLEKMKEKNPAKFIEIFGDGDVEISENLLSTTTVGRSDLINNDEVPISGQAYWNKIRKQKEGKDLTKLANGPTQSDLPVSREIRGKRVQPIPPNKGSVGADIWTGVWKERFLAAGNVLDFQEVQLEFAVERYVKPLLALAKKNRVRSALALAFIAACNIRGGPGSELSRLLYNVANELKIPLPFSSSEDERKCLDAIAAANGKIGTIDVDKDET